MSDTSTPRRIGAIYLAAPPWARLLLVAMLAGAATGGALVGYRAVGPAIASGHAP